METTAITVESARYDLAENVASRRRALGMSQGRLAQAAGVSQVSISRIEGGDMWPGPKTLVAIANALQTTISDLFNSEIFSQADA